MHRYFFFGRANVFARKTAVLKLLKIGGSGASQRELPFLPKGKFLNNNVWGQVLWARETDRDPSQTLVFHKREWAHPLLFSLKQLDTSLVEITVILGRPMSSGQRVASDGGYNNTNINKQLSPPQNTPALLANRPSSACKGGATGGALFSQLTFNFGTTQNCAGWEILNSVAS